jgi:hypothetical protein
MSASHIVDITTAVRLQKRLSSAAFSSGLLLYLEALVAFVLIEERILHPAAIVPLAGIIAWQYASIRQPVRKLVAGRLVPSYRRHLFLSLLFVFALFAAASGLEDRIAAGVLGCIVAGAMAWPVVAALRTATAADRDIGNVNDGRALMECFTWVPQRILAERIRSAGGTRSRWLAPLAAAAAALALTAVTLATLLDAIGLGTPGGPIAQVSAIVAIFVFYRAVRHVKPDAATLRQRDTRPPVLLLRQFTDDTLTAGRRSLGVGPTFEHFIAGELTRIGPTIAVGRPGERLPPLGAAREYLAGGDWQQVVGTHIRHAGLVVFVLGGSDSLLWEFRAAMTSRPAEGLLIVVPPLRDAPELARRWERFVAGTRDLVAGLPHRLPHDPVLAVFFVGGRAVLMTSRERAGRQAFAYQTLPEYRVALRVFACIRRESPGSIDELDGFLRGSMPVATLRPA